MGKPLFWATLPLHVSLAAQDLAVAVTARLLICLLAAGPGTVHVAE